MRRSDHRPVNDRSLTVPSTGSSSARYLKEVIVRRSSSNRTCQQQVFPPRIAALPPAAVNASSRSRIPQDQYSSCPTETRSRRSSNRSGLASRSVEIATSTSNPLRSAQWRNGRSQFHHPAPPLHTDSPSRSAHSKNHSPSRSG